MTAASLYIDACIVRLDESPPGSRSILSAAEIEKALAIDDPVLRRRYENTRWRLRHVLGRYLDLDPARIDFAIAAGGKPYVTGDFRCDFSISHSNDWLAIAVAKFRVGIDIEARRPRVEAVVLARRFFSMADSLVVQGTAPPSQTDVFLRQWVAKEAALKVHGLGISQHLHQSECSYESDSIRTVQCGADEYSVHGFCLPDGSPGAIAWEKGIAASVRWSSV
ncbi:MAG TPA: 4'-phosphopantetheinyl transferase superfamily protein [Chthoniobacterales bacterium]